MALKADVRNKLMRRRNTLGTCFATGGTVNNPQDIGKLIGQFGCTYPNLAYSTQFVYDSDVVLSVERMREASPIIAFDYLKLMENTPNRNANIRNFPGRNRNHS